MKEIIVDRKLKTLTYVDCNLKLLCFFLITICKYHIIEDMIPRIAKIFIEDIINNGKAVILLGPRQVGKTTLLHSIAEDYNQTLFLDCDEPDIRKLLTDTTSTALKNLFGQSKLIIIDEAQRIKNIGLTLKLITDKIKSVKLIVSGSSALELSADISEPLTGRKVEIVLSGLSTMEMVSHHGELEEKRLLHQRLVYGMYPEIITHPERAAQQLHELTTGYLYKDVFNYQDIRKPELLPNLLEALARQLGSEVSYNELANLLSSDPTTISRYIDLLEKSMVVFRLRSFSRNLRNELKKSRKIYFYDNGIRNAILSDFRPFDLRLDNGALWENFMITERIKSQFIKAVEPNRYFWRTRQQQEIDYIEESSGEINAYEFKVSPKKKGKFSRTFRQEYHPKSMTTVNPENYMEFVIDS